MTGVAVSAVYGRFGADPNESTLRRDEFRTRKRTADGWVRCRCRTGEHQIRGNDDWRVHQHGHARSSSMRNPWNKIGGRRSGSGHVGQPLMSRSRSPRRWSRGSRMRMPEIGLSMPDQRPLTPSLSRGPQPCALASQTSRFRCRDAARTVRPTVITSSIGARTSVFGTRNRSTFDSDRSIASENRAERLGTQLHFAQSGRGVPSPARMRRRLIFLKNCERCQIAHSSTSAVRFETSSAMRNLAKFVVHHQELKQRAGVGTAVATAMQQH